MPTRSTARGGPILVTGASSGIGRAITEALSERGEAVFATARRAADRSALAKLPGVTPLRLDVTEEGEVREAVLAIEKRQTGLYGLVNNAGLANTRPLVDTSVDDLAREMDVNFYGAHRMVRAFFPLLRTSRGRVVNISSINGIAPVEFYAGYCASKFALEAYSEVLREELAGLGIHVCVVEPGGFRSAIVANMVAHLRMLSDRETADPSIHERFQKALKEFAGAPRDRDRTNYPDPRPVADAVVDALFSDAPPPRILIGKKEETDWVLDHVVRVLGQLNQSSGHPATPEELISRLKR